MGRSLTLGCVLSLVLVAAGASATAGSGAEVVPGDLRAPRTISRSAPPAARLASGGSGNSAGERGHLRASAEPTRGDILTRARANRGAGYFDVCDDSHVDLHSAIIVDSDDTGNFVFAFETCAGTAVTPDSMPVVFDLDIDRDGYLDYSVALVRTDDGLYRVRVFDSSSSDPSDWTLVYDGTAHQEQQQDRSNWFAAGAVPSSVLEDTDDFVFLVTALEADGDRTDLLPEADEGLLYFPDTCDYFEFESAETTVDPAALPGLVGELRARGFTVSGVAPTFGSFAVHPVDDDGLRLLRRAPGVRSVERPEALTPAALPDDPEPTAWALRQINAEAGWERRDAAQVHVAVLDDGIDPTRTDLSGRVGAGYDAVTARRFRAGANTARGYHGTSVAGVLAGASNNGTEVAGINADAVVHPYRVFDASSCGHPAYAAAALDEVVSSGHARLVNMSFGSVESSAVLEHAVSQAARAGLIMVAAAGNEGRRSVSYPAAYPEVIGVGATTASGGHAPYSNTGGGVHLVAPGGDESATRSGDIGVLADFDRLEHAAGTSFSAPYVTGAVSLLLGGDADLTPTEVAGLLADTAEDAGPSGPDDTFGHGILDLGALLDAAATEDPAAPDEDDTTDEHGVFDGDPATTGRLSSNDVFRAAVAVSTRRFPQAAPRARHVVLARHDTFADALAGSSLTGDGPLLFAFREGVPDFVLREIDRVLPGGGRVYMLGGEAALTPTVVAQLRAAGHSPLRLHGRDRVETSVAVANKVVELYGPTGTVVVARAFAPPHDPTAAWADAIAVSSYTAATTTPMLLTGSDGLHPAAADWLAGNPRPRRVLLGGEAALSGTLWGQVNGTKTRIAGRDRAGTAVRIANDLWQQPFGGSRSAAVLNGWHDQGWAMGLAGAGAAADARAPLFLTATSSVPPVTRDRVSNCDTPAVDLYLLGGEQHISERVARDLDSVDGKAC